MGKSIYVCVSLPCECSSFCSGSIKDIFGNNEELSVWHILDYNSVLYSLSPQLTTPIKWWLEKDLWMVRRGIEIKYKMISPSPEAGSKRNYIKKKKKALTKFLKFWKIQKVKGVGWYIQSAGLGLRVPEELGTTGVRQSRWTLCGKTPIPHLQKTGEGWR